MTLTNRFFLTNQIYKKKKKNLRCYSEMTLRVKSELTADFLNETANNVLVMSDFK